MDGQDNSRYGVVKTYVEMAVRLLEGCTTTDRSRRAGIKPSTYIPVNKLGAAHPTRGQLGVSMTDAGWTSNKPTKEGWYWWRNLPTDNAPEVWAIVDHGDGLEVVGPFDETCLDEWVADMKGEWLGPISPTDRQQGRVEGLRAAARQLREGERLAQSREVANALQGHAYMLEQQAQGGQQ